MNKAEIIVFPHCDHHAIILEINDHNQRPRGPGYWVFNATLLEDKKYVDELNNKMPQFIDYHRGIEDKGLFWEMIKMEIRAVSIAYSKRKAKTLRDYENELTNKAQALLRDYNETNSQQTIDQYNKIKKELEHISFTRTNVSCIRSKARWYEFGERSTKFFLNLELRNSINKSITKLIKDNGNTITDPDEILDEQKTFYENLYASQRPDVNDSKFDLFFKNENIKKLNNEQKATCDGLLTLDEFWSTLRKFQEK